MSFSRRNHEKKKRKTLDFQMEDVAFFIKIISTGAGGLMFFSIIAFLLTGRGQETDVIYVMVISLNALVFIIGTLFIKKVQKKDKE